MRFAFLLLQYVVLAVTLAGVPLAACALWGDADVLSGVTAFPPRTEDWINDAARCWPKVCPFSWVWFGAMAAVTLAWFAPFVRRGLRAIAVPRVEPRARPPFPWWGWIGVTLLAGFWTLAWTWQWYLPFQPHTYAPLWLGAIITFNAVAKKRSGRCPLTDRPLMYLASFPVSSLFWWFFEYLNRYVWNWYYVATSTMSATRYVVIASICFSTVLPGIWAMAEALGTFRFFDDRNYDGMARVNYRSPVSISVLALLSAVGLVGIAVRPQDVFGFLWISPLMMFVLVQAAFGSPCVLDGLRDGRWGLVFRFSIAALCCGVCWEMWNWQSYVKWIYNVPHVYGFKIFEMPLIGFAGYLPFGAECAAVLHWMGAFGNDKSKGNT